MNIVGIIAEFNPFHNGHAYLIDQARQLTDADAILVLMSGDFVQRGVPALTDKYTRTRAALANGADLVMELPVYYATASAERFAEGAVSLLDQLGVVNTLCFGCETNDPALLYTLADILIREPESYKTRLRKGISCGLSFPEARAQALSACFDASQEDISKLLASPNNILAIEYIKALKRRNSNIRPCPIPRVGESYASDALTPPYASATAIRTYLKDVLLPDHSKTTQAAYEQRFLYPSGNIRQSLGNPVSDEEAARLQYAGSLCTPLACTNGGYRLSDSIRQTLNTVMPSSAINALVDENGNFFPVFEDALSVPLHYKLLCTPETSLDTYADISPELASRFAKNLPYYLGFSQFSNLCKTKELTQSRINRALLHLLLNIKKKDSPEEKHWQSADYIRLLGCKKESTSLLGEIKKHARISLITNVSAAACRSTSAAQALWETDLFAAHFYQLLLTHCHGIAGQHEYRRPICGLTDPS